MIFDFTIFITPMVLFTRPKLKRKNILALAGILTFGSVYVANPPPPTPRLLLGLYAIY